MSARRDRVVFSRRIDAEKGAARVTHCCQDSRPDIGVER